MSGPETRTRPTLFSRSCNETFGIPCILSPRASSYTYMPIPWHRSRTREKCNDVIAVQQPILKSVRSRGGCNPSARILSTNTVLHARRRTNHVWCCYWYVLYPYPRICAYIYVKYTVNHKSFAYYFNKEIDPT